MNSFYLLSGNFSRGGDCMGKIKYITCLLTMIFWLMTAGFVFASSQPIMMVKGKALQAGDTIGIAGPASPVTQSDFSVMQTRLHNMAIM